MSWTSYENNGGLMAEGDYECICVKVEETETKTTHTPVIKFDFQVRSDVEQKYQRKHIFKSFFKDDDDQWPVEKIGKLANSMGIPKGQSFELRDLEGKCLILHMRPYKGKDGVERDSIGWTAQTKAGQYGQPLPNALAGSGYTLVEEDEETPF